ncbi:GAF domain-containing protein [Streptomyces sp. NPDC051041]|uniref:GAF domain-containing protein n=1 Tax=Streptomyces sp. NPDC051041 TaxID=3365640 RepID=UPI00378BF44C
MTYESGPPRLPSRPMVRDPRTVPGRQPAETITPPAGLITPGTVSGETAQKLAELPARSGLIRRLGLPTNPDPVFDGIATRMAADAGFLYGMVNLFLDKQTFIGLCNPPQGSGHPIVGRTMDLRHGWCPEVVQRKKALPLHNVHAAPRFSSNPVVDAIGIQSYFGAPLIHADSGITLGTVCIVDPEPRLLQDARRLRDIVTAAGAEVMTVITDRTPAS